MKEVLQKIIERGENLSEIIDIKVTNDDILTLVLSYVVKNLSLSSQVKFSETMLKYDNIEKAVLDSILNEIINDVLIEEVNRLEKNA
jgi:hypothetical protein